jgi:hypothetical protein
LQKEKKTSFGFSQNLEKYFAQRTLSRFQTLTRLIKSEKINLTERDCFVSRNNKVVAKTGFSGKGKQNVVLALIAAASFFLGD